MTTLPQSTPLRGPQRGGTALAIPGASVIVPATPQASFNLSSNDILRVLRANALLIILLLIVGGLIGYSVNMWLLATRARYTSTGNLRIMGEKEVSTPGDFFPRSAADLNIDIEGHEQAALLLQPSLMARVLDNSTAIRQTQWFASHMHNVDGKSTFDVEGAKRDLMENLEVAPVPATRLLSVSFSGSRPEDCQIILREIVSQHISEQRQLHQESESEESRLLDRIKLQYEGDLSETQGRISRIMQDLGANGQPINAAGTRDIELQTLEAAQIREQETLLEAQTRLDHLKSYSAGQPDPEIEQQILSDPNYAALQSRIDALTTAIDQDKATLGSKNPDVIRLGQELEVLQRKAKTLHETLRTDFVSRRENFLNETVATNKAALDATNSRLKTVLGSMAELAGQRNQYEQLKTEEQATIEKLNKLKDAEQSLANWNENGKFSTVDWATLPDLPDQDAPTFPRLSMTMGTAISLALSLGLGIAFLREVTNTSVRSPRDIARIGQMNVLGMIPHQEDDPQAVGARPALIIVDAPSSMVAEQFRQVRTRLQHAASLDTTRSIVVTACSPGDGNTTIACNLAAGLALNGRRILLVDANFRRPQLHQIFNLDNSLGFGDVLAAAQSFDAAVRETSVPNLAVMVLGTKPHNPTELLESQLLIDFIERALEEFDHVIFDSGPMLIVSETNGLAPRVDGVITVVRAMGNSRGILQRMRDQLRQLKAEHLGVILNAVRVHGGGYYGPLIKTYYAYQNGGTNAPANGSANGHSNGHANGNGNGSGNGNGNGSANGDE
jgi:capsular exopolysaccharide synthesis family protein